MWCADIWPEVRRKKSSIGFQSFTKQDATSERLESPGHSAFDKNCAPSHQVAVPAGNANGCFHRCNIVCPNFVLSLNVGIWHVQSRLESILSNLSAMPKFTGTSTDRSSKGRQRSSSPCCSLILACAIPVLPLPKCSFKYRPLKGMCIQPLVLHIPNHTRNPTCKLQSRQSYCTSIL